MDLRATENMSGEPMTPQEDPFDNQQTVPSSNHSISYNQDFENSVMQTVLAPPQEDGVVLLKDGEDPPANASSSLRSEIDASALAKVPVSDLPLSLDHPSRIYRSTVPGIRLTHPGGFLEGGAGPGSTEAAVATERAEFIQTLIEENRVRKASAFWQVVEREKQDALKELEDRMRTRQKALKQNADIEAQLIQLKEQRDLQVRVVENRIRMGKG